MIRRALSCVGCLITPVLLLALVVAAIWFYPLVRSGIAQLDQKAKADLVQIRRETKPSPTPTSPPTKVELRGGAVCNVLPGDPAPAGGGDWYDCGAAGYLNGPPFHWKSGDPLVADLTIDGGVTGQQVQVVREWW